MKQLAVVENYNVRKDGSRQYLVHFCTVQANSLTFLSSRCSLWLGMCL